MLNWDESYSSIYVNFWSGPEGICLCWWAFAEESSRIARSFGLGIFSLKHSRIQQGGMLGTTTGYFLTFHWSPEGEQEKPNKQLMEYAKTVPRGLLLLLPTNELDPFLPLPGWWWWWWLSSVQCEQNSIPAGSTSAAELRMWWLCFRLLVSTKFI